MNAEVDEAACRLFLTLRCDLIGRHGGELLTLLSAKRKRGRGNGSRSRGESNVDGCCSVRKYLEFLCGSIAAVNEPQLLQQRIAKKALE